MPVHDGGGSEDSLGISGEVEMESHAVIVCLSTPLPSSPAFSPVHHTRSLIRSSQAETGKLPNRNEEESPIEVSKLARPAKE